MHPLIMIPNPLHHNHPQQFVNIPFDDVLVLLRIPSDDKIVVDVYHVVLFEKVLLVVIHQQCQWMQQKQYQKLQHYCRNKKQRQIIIIINVKDDDVLKTMIIQPKNRLYDDLDHDVDIQRQNKMMICHVMENNNNAVHHYIEEDVRRMIRKLRIIVNAVHRYTEEDVHVRNSRIQVPNEVHHYIEKEGVIISNKNNKNDQRHLVAKRKEVTRHPKLIIINQHHPIINVRRRLDGEERREMLAVHVLRL
mmetsp:Transcript_8792/g.25301  ORF Transcript_8792/g.25301 Transcript_8792/m.25301 type:complete len:248 (-) Transcript_8792:1184-1927(-)